MIDGGEEHGDCGDHQLFVEVAPSLALRHWRCTEASVNVSLDLGVQRSCCRPVSCLSDSRRHRDMFTLQGTSTPLIEGPRPAHGQPALPIPIHLSPFMTSLKATLSASPVAICEYFQAAVHPQHQCFKCDGLHDTTTNNRASTCPLIGMPPPFFFIRFHLLLLLVFCHKTDGIIVHFRRRARWDCWSGKALVHRAHKGQTGKS